MTRCTQFNSRLVFASIRAIFPQHRSSWRVLCHSIRKPVYF